MRRASAIFSAGLRTGSRQTIKGLHHNAYRCRDSDGLKEMAEIVGVEHVSFGTDQFDARGCVDDYTRWVHLVAAMLCSGFTPEEAGKIAGGNYLRIFRAAVG